MARRGVLLSEYPLGTPPLAANFPSATAHRGPSRGTLVVEAALASGSLITRGWPPSRARRCLPSPAPSIRPSRAAATR
jgi:DNA processing protein